MIIINWKNIKKTKEKLFEKRLQEKLGNQSFYYDMKQVFETSIEAQEESTKKIIKVTRPYSKSNYRRIRKFKSYFK